MDNQQRSSEQENVQRLSLYGSRAASDWLSEVAGTYLGEDIVRSSGKPEAAMCGAGSSVPIFDCCYFFYKEVSTMMFNDLSGQRFGRLTVIERAPNQGRRTMFKCVCDCGNTVVVRSENLQSGNTTSCGCYEKDHPSNFKHGMSGTRLATVLSGMKSRCYNKNNAEYELYGGRGIKICDEWLSDPAKFYDWAISSGFNENAKQAECSIDRIDFNGDYTPENCRWVDSYMQANNTRKNIYYSFNGESHTLPEWGRITGINSGTLYNRVNRLGWSIGEALTLHPSHISHRN